MEKGPELKFIARLADRFNLSTSSATCGAIPGAFPLDGLPSLPTAKTLAKPRFGIRRWTQQPKPGAGVGGRLSVTCLRIRFRHRGSEEDDLQASSIRNRAPASWNREPATGSLQRYHIGQMVFLAKQIKGKNGSHRAFPKVSFVQPGEVLEAGTKGMHFHRHEPYLFRYYIFPER